MLRSSLSLCLKKAAAIDAAAAASMTAQRRHGAGVTLLTSRASSYASSSSNASSEADSAVSSPTYFSSLSLANPSVQTSAPYSSSAATATIRTTTYQVPSGMGTSTPAQCYRSVEEPTLHEDYDGLEFHHTVSEKTHASYYNYSYEPEESFEEMGPIL